MVEETLQQNDSALREKKKTELARAQDIAYTVNHAVVCTVADIFSTPINAMTQKWLGTSLVGCGDHTHTDKPKAKRSFWSYFGHVAPAEIAADVIAVPITVGVQRVFPGFMDGLSKVMEPVFGDLFKFGAKHGGKSWARKHGLDPDGAEAKEKAKEIYQHEATHLGQAAVWTASAFGLNVGIQYATESIKPPIGGRTPLRTLIAAKGVGSTITSVALVSLRGFLPNLAEGIDDWTSKHIFIPLSRKIAGLFGLSNDTLKDLEQQEAAQDKYWDDKVAKAKLHKIYEAGKPTPAVASISEHIAPAPETLAKQA